MNAGIIIAIGMGTLLVALVVGLVAYRMGYRKRQKEEEQAYVEGRSRAERIVAEAEAKARHILSEAESRVKEWELKARDEALRLRRQVEQELEAQRREIREEMNRLQRRWDELERRQDDLRRKEAELAHQEQELIRREQALSQAEEEIARRLEEISGLSREEARQRLLAQVEQEARQDMARLIRQMEAKAMEEAEARARKIIATAMQRIASDTVAELTTSVVPLPSDEMKGRIIGRSGRNIRAFEQVTGVEVIVDDTPEAVTLSSFDPVRREIARRALVKLVTDGRIHPTQIEKVVAQEKEAVEKIIEEAGEEAAYEAGVVGLPKEVIKMLGRLKFRTSYGQNQLHHAVEVAKLAAMLAAELGADVEVAKTAGLLHDIGKAMDHNAEGPHALVGAEFLERHGVDPRVVHAVAAHHHDIEQETLEDVIVEVADALSGARPGARRESLEEYLKRIRALEEIARSFEGVEDCYALQAGREIRVIVKPEAVDDYALAKLAHEIAKAIETHLQFSGQIQVTVIRERRATDLARPGGRNGRGEKSRS